MTALGKREAEEGVARLHQHEVDRRVGLRAGVRLHVHKFRTEQRFQSLDGERLRDVNILAAAVVAATGVALSVFVGELRALRLHHGFRRVVLAGDQLDVIFLALVFGVDNGEDFGVNGGERRGEKFRAGVHEHVLSKR